MWRAGEPLRWQGAKTWGAVRVLLVVTIGAFVLQKLIDSRTHGLFTTLFGLSSVPLFQGELWRLVTYLFLHGGFWHIVINALSLAIFGREVEEHLGTRRFLSLFFSCGIIGGIGWVLISGTQAGTCIGASGAVFGVIGAFAAVFPDRQITLLLFLVLPVTMTARMMAMGMMGLTLLLMVAGDGSIAHAAHLVGGLMGYIWGRKWSRAYGVPAVAERPSDVFAAEADAEGPRRPWRLFGREEAPPDPGEVDRILEKIKARGIGALSRRERQILDKASRHVG